MTGNIYDRILEMEQEVARAKMQAAYMEQINIVQQAGINFIMDQLAGMMRAPWDLLAMEIRQMKEPKP